MNKLLVSLTASLALLAAGPALAQENQQSPEAADTEGGYSDPAAAGTQNTNFSDQELKQFVEAQEGINDIRDEYMEKIEDAGMDIPTYNSIATAYNSEPKVRNRVDALM